LQDLIFRNQPKDDPLGLRADLRAGALSSLIGIAAYKEHWTPYAFSTCH
jgi:hypothetical protein